MIGILPTKEYENYGFDMFTDYSMIYPSWTAKYFRFTKSEVEILCNKLLKNEKENNYSLQNSMNKKQKLNDNLESEILKEDENFEIEEEVELFHKKKSILESIEHWYKGYQLLDLHTKTKTLYELYTPYSIINTIERESIEELNMGNCLDLIDHISNNFEKLKYSMISLADSKIVKLNIKAKGDLKIVNRCKALKFLIHLGYLNYNHNTDEVFIPNRDIKQMIKTFLKSDQWKILNAKESNFKIFNPGCYKINNSICIDTYVDKTELILHFNELIEKGKDGKSFICDSRPRRFGKSITDYMLVAYYSYTESEIPFFNDKKISKTKNWDKYLGKFNVINLNMINYFLEHDFEDGKKMISMELCKEIKRRIPNFKFNNKNDLKVILKDLFNLTKRRNIVIIDEYDLIIRKKEDENTIKKYLKFLIGLFKDKNETNVDLVYITGILPLKQIEINSGLNNFSEYSMIYPSWMAKFIGFTEKEVDDLYDRYEKYEKKGFSRNFKDEVKKWYNGYKLIDENNLTYKIYTPYSIINALFYREIGDYWTKTETSKFLSDYINMNYERLKEDIGFLIKNKKIKIDVKNFQNDFTSINSKDDIFTLLVHTGYLGYDKENKEVFIPNKEIKEQFESIVKTNANWKFTMNKLIHSENLLKATLRGDAEIVVKYLEDAHDDGSNNTYNNKATLSYAIQLAYYKAEDYYNKSLEVDSGNGFADIVYFPTDEVIKYDYPPFIVELKYNESAESGIQQIKNREYPKIFEKYYGKILLVCINYNKEIKSNCPGYKHHSCIIEEIEKKKF
ncbi:hypothetical protein BCR36DRAFT_587195 [Piromyces finnis]|uniref:AAA-ATPase-like domain-containing protein n=1 Tax=Piromyces finnis TaxID=1754191 RepID=A0A1Y1UXT0_9FUNG|nr:hypothetical protein BCR36DRAFT_587195 [Piromyces finnis]|eukprot:ORX42502.1 hypothetical protein BCR36DRAFT_587195 [Piromyces finnis]